MCASNCRQHRFWRASGSPCSRSFLAFVKGARRHSEGLTTDVVAAHVVVDNDFHARRLTEIDEANVLGGDAHYNNQFGDESNDLHHRGTRHDEFAARQGTEALSDAKHRWAGSLVLGSLKRVFFSCMIFNSRNWSLSIPP